MEQKRRDADLQGFKRRVLITINKDDYGYNQLMKRCQNEVSNSGSKNFLCIKYICKFMKKFLEFMKPASDVPAVEYVPFFESTHAVKRFE